MSVFSIRMRAAEGGAHEEGGRHVSGAERLVLEEDCEREAMAMIRRARSHGDRSNCGPYSDGTKGTGYRKRPDFTQITIERISASEISETACLPVTLSSAATAGESEVEATAILTKAGVSRQAISTAFFAIRRGLGRNGSTPRGAALLDLRTGNRIEADRDRGVRASRFGYAPGAGSLIEAILARHGLSHFRTQEAVALATKVIWSGVTAELCWSDEPDYAAGYVATAGDGYVRFANFKPAGAAGGRVFFVDPSRIELEAVVDRLERKALWITAPFTVAPSLISSKKVSQYDPDYA